MAQQFGENLQINKKRRIWVYVALLAGLMLIGVAIVFILQMQTVNGVSASVTKFSNTNTFLVFTADSEIQLINRGMFDVSLRDATVTVFVNDNNVQTKNFQQDVLVIGANRYETFDATIGTFDSQVVSKLQAAESYHVVLELSALASSGFYSAPINLVFDQGTWNANANPAVSPTPPSATSMPQTTSTPVVGSSRSNPAPIGTSLEAQFDYLLQPYRARVTVLEVKRGEEAWSQIYQANRYNSAPDTGFEYTLVKIRFEYLEGPTTESKYDLSTYQFSAVSANGQQYDSVFVVNPEPSLDSSLYPGASCEGWTTFKVSTTDLQPVLSFGSDYFGLGGVWFRLY